MTFLPLLRVEWVRTNFSWSADRKGSFCPGSIRVPRADELSPGKVVT